MPVLHSLQVLQRLRPWSAAVIAFGILFFAVTNQSIDVEEAQTWHFLKFENLDDCWLALSQDKNPEAQAPGGVLASWIWTRLVGTSEYGMRSINLLWAAITLGALAEVGRRISIPWLPLLFAVQPFVWQAMNHARTPMMQMAGGALLLGSTVSVLQKSSLNLGNLLALMAGSIALAGASMLGIVPVFVVIFGLFLHGFWKSISGSVVLKLVLTASSGILAALIIYYLATLLRGVSWVKLWTVSPLNLFYAAYEFLGFQGLGPARQTLREIAKGLESPVVLLWAVPGILLMAACYLGATLSAMKSWLTKEFSIPRPSKFHGWVWILCVGVILESVIMISLLALAFGFPFWGKHLSGVFPFWIAALGLLIVWSRQGLWRKAGRFASAALILMLIISSLSVRVLPFHGHDDYRSAAADARARLNNGEQLWWVADKASGLYYGVPFDQNSDNGGRILFAHNMPADAQSPDSIVISRPENFDTRKTASNFLLSGDFINVKSFAAFEIWEKKPVIEKTER